MFFALEQIFFGAVQLLQLGRAVESPLLIRLTLHRLRDRGREHRARTRLTFLSEKVSGSRNTLLTPLSFV